MKTIFFAIVLVVLTSTATYSNYSMLTCQAERGTTIRVYLNGKLINKKPNETVRLKSNDGCHSISVVIYNSSDNTNLSVQRDIDIEAGYEVYFQVKRDECGAWLSLSRRYPLLNSYSYSKKLYVRQLIS